MSGELEVQCSERWLEVRFAAPQQTLSWALVNGGLRRAEGVAWHYVRRDELPEEVDAAALLRERMAQRGLSAAVGLLTARDLSRYASAERERAGLRAHCVATVGLGNALRTGDAAAYPEPVGTINVLCHLNAPLSELAMLEALGLVVEARTAALLELACPSIVSGRPASGTGTDCCVIAVPELRAEAPYAGKHTLAGELIGGAVEHAVRAAALAWLEDEAAAAPR